MRDFLNNWRNSKKYAELRKKLDEKKESLKQNGPNMEEYTPNEVLSKQELRYVMAGRYMLEIDEEEIQARIITANMMPINDYFISFASDVTQWFFYLSIYLVKEDYEFCAELRDIISLELKTYKNIVSHHDEYVEGENDYKIIGDTLISKIYNQITLFIEKENSKKK